MNILVYTFNMYRFFIAIHSRKTWIWDSSTSPVDIDDIGSALLMTQKRISPYIGIIEPVHGSKYVYEKVWITPYFHFINSSKRTVHAIEIHLRLNTVINYYKLMKMVNLYKHMYIDSFEFYISSSKTLKWIHFYFNKII